MTHMYAYSRTVSTTAMYTFNLVSWLIPRLSAHTFFMSLPNAELTLGSLWPYTTMDWRLRSANFVTADNRRRYGVTLLLNQLQEQILLQRHPHCKVTMLYRSHHQRVAIPAGPPYIIYSNTTTRGHHLQLQQHHCRINSCQHSFFPSVVNLWNQLPSDTVGAASLNLFQNRLASLTLH